MKKYIVWEGYVSSSNDDGFHFLNAGVLMDLYGVKPSECIIIKWNDIDLKALRGFRGTFLKLRPSYSGNYSLDNCPSVVWPVSNNQ